jgi:proline dehydrogenase
MIPPIANRFVAGEDVASVLDHAHDLNQEGVKAILNLLGEHYERRVPAAADVAVYRDLVDGIADRDLEACISVKPSQIGLDVGDSVFEEHLAEVVDYAAARDVFVWVDMEDADTTDVTLDAFEANATEHGGGVGVCVQANLRRTREDLKRLAPLPGKVRLVKGAYNEPKTIAHTEKSTVDEVYREYLAFMFREFEDGVAVGSHDPAMISYAKELHAEYGTPFEVQMLMGVREDAQRDLAQEYEMYQYVPYGDKWFSYFYRRVRERKENALFALRAVLF